MEISLFFMIMGVVLIAFELLILQLATFWVFFIGVAAVIASLAAYFFPFLGWTETIAVFATVIVAEVLLLLRPMRRWRNAPGKLQGNDAIGQLATVVTAVKPGSNKGTVTWSGSEWSARLSEGATEVLDAGEEARIAALKGITLIVEAVEK